MIRFACPHCGKQYTVDDKLSGRHGWCALCMGLLAVPPADDPAQSRELSPEEKLEYLRGLLKAAEDRFKAYKDRFQKTDRLARALYQKRKALEGDLSEQGQRIANQSGRIEEALAQSLRLTQELEASARARGEGEALLARAREDVERLRAELAAEREARTLAEEAQRTVQGVSVSHEPDEDRSALVSALACLRDDLETERTARTDAEHACQAAEVRVAGLAGQLQRAEEELERSRKQAAHGQALEGQVERLERDRTALRDLYEQTVQALGVAEGRVQQALAELERQQQLAATVPASVVPGTAEENHAELERLREELREERSARLELSKSKLELELRAAQALRDAQDRRAHIEAVEATVAEAERAFVEATARAERLTGELETARTELAQARADAKNVAELESGLRVSLARAEELHQANTLLTTELGLAARATGAAEARVGELSRELERLAGNLELECALRREADERARDLGNDLRAAESRLAEALRQAEEAEERAARKAAYTPPPPKPVDPGQVTLVPELVDAPETDDQMMETLLRFIEPE